MDRSVDSDVCFGSLADIRERIEMSALRQDADMLTGSCGGAFPPSPYGTHVRDQGDVFADAGWRPPLDEEPLAAVKSLPL